MESSSNSSRGEGNNISSPLKKKQKMQISPAKKWCFTLFNYNEEDIIEICSKLSKYGRYGFQEEKTKESKLHLQGYCYFDKKRRPKSLKLNVMIHWEKMKGSLEENETYCNKVGGLRKWGNFMVSSILKVIRDMDLYDWQKELMVILNKKPEDRKIYWIWEPNGNVGKTCFCKKLCIERRALLVGGEAKDMKFAIMNMVKIDTDWKPEILLIDVPRDSGNRISYAGLEQIKQGLFFSNKYESGMCIFNPPHLIVFANEAPQIGKLSTDKIEILQIVNGKFVKYSPLELACDDWDF